MKVRDWHNYGQLNVNILNTFLLSFLIHMGSNSCPQLHLCNAIDWQKHVKLKDKLIKQCDSSYGWTFKLVHILSELFHPSLLQLFANSLVMEAITSLWTAAIFLRTFAKQQDKILSRLHLSWMKLKRNKFKSDIRKQFFSQQKMNLFNSDRCIWEQELSRSLKVIRHLWIMRASTVTSDWVYFFYIKQVNLHASAHKLNKLIRVRKQLFLGVGYFIIIFWTFLWSICEAIVRTGCWTKWTSSPIYYSLHSY